MFELDEFDLKRRSGKPNEIKKISFRDIAIVGIALRMPMAETPDDFWSNIRNGRDCVSRIPSDRKRDVMHYASCLGIHIDGMIETGYLNEIDAFDYRFFKLSPKEAELMDPHQRLFLQTAWHAVEDSGYGADRLKGSATGVYVGFGASDPYDYKKLIGAVDPASEAMATTGNIVSVMAGRIAYLLDLKGPAIVVDTACSSSLVAVHLAVQGIRNGDCEMAIAGAVRVGLLPVEKKQKLGIESSDYRTRSFDNSADGTVLGEGVAAVVLKPLRRALADRDNIYAVIKGTAVNQDGRTAGITAPNALSQAAVIEKAWQDAGVEPATITFIEAHGTGTRLGDPIEIDGITKAFGKYTDQKQFCAVGAVKSNIGHLDSTAGMAGLAKAVLCLKYGEIPPSIHFRKPNRTIRFHRSPVYVNDRLVRWETGDMPRRCGVSAFGLSGTNSHIVLEEAPAREKGRREKDGLQVLTLSAENRFALEDLAELFADRLRSFNGEDFGDICHTANTGRGRYRFRLAVVAGSLRELERKLKLIRGGMYVQAEGIYSGEAPDDDESGREAAARYTGEAAAAMNLYVSGPGQNEALLHDIARLYAVGADVSWADLYREGSFRKVSLPGYPFEKARCWLENDALAGHHDFISGRNLYHTVAWEPQELPERDGSPVKGTVLVLKDNKGVGDELSAELKAKGFQVVEAVEDSRFLKHSDSLYSVNQEEDGYRRLFEAIGTYPLRYIVHLFTVGSDGIKTSDDLERFHQKGILSLYYIVRAFNSGGFRNALKLLLVSDYAYGVSEEQERIKPEGAAFFGLGKSICYENPLLKIKCLDMDEPETGKIADELLSDDNEYMTAYRKGRRYVERIEPLSVNGRDGFCIRENGVYVITGGTGLIGLEIGKHIASLNKAVIVLMGRTPLPPREEWERILYYREDQKEYKRIKAVMDMERSGAVVANEICDVASESRLECSLASIRNRFGGINGIVHCAGIGIGSNGKLLADDSVDSLMKVILPKIKGAWLLDKYTERDGLDFFVLCSSVMSLVGGVGFAAYTAANAYLDAFPGYRNKKGGRTLTVNWTTWQETFIRHVLEDGTAESIRKYKERQMFRVITPDTALKAFEEAVASGADRVIAGEFNYASEIFSLADQLSCRLSEETLREIRNGGGGNPGERYQAQDSLPAVLLAGSEDGGYTETERRVAGVWSRILGYGEINIFDSFYELGGDSISMMKVVNGVRESLGADISFKEFAENNTVHDLSAVVEGHISKGGNGRPVYPQCRVDTENLYQPFPLTNIQMAYLLGRNEEFELGGISTHAYSEMETRMDMERFNSCLNRVIMRHPMLRAVVLPEGVQRILDKTGEYVIRVEDISGLDREEQERRIGVERERMSHSVFRTDQWPLFEFRAFKTSESTHCLCIGFDVLIADGASMNIIINEIMDLYMRPDSMTAEIPLSFRDYIMALEDFKRLDTYRTDREYWLGRLEDFPQPPSLPLACNPGEVKKPHFKRISKVFEKQEWDKLKRLAQQNNITPSALLLTAYACVLSYWSGQARMGLNLTVFNRYPFHEEAEKLVGDFTSVMLLDIGFKPGRSFRDKAEAVQDILIEALEHRHYDGVEFIRELSRRRQAGVGAVMPIVFTSMLFSDKNYAAVNYDEYFRVRRRLTQTSQVYLDHQASEYNGKLELSWDYVEELFGDSMINGMFEQYTGLLSGILSKSVFSGFVPPEADMKLIEAYNDTDEELGETTLCRMFAEKADEFPGRTAVISGDSQLTYRELHERSDRMARRLRSMGIGRNDYVGISCKRCPNTIVHIMGVLKAGAAYIPIEPDYPEERRKYILENSRCKLFVEPDYIDGLTDAVMEGHVDESNPDDVAYVIYTSGSTGTPKGVVITHRAAANTIMDINRKFGVDENDKIPGISSMCFDLSVYDIFGALSTGATLVQVYDQRDVTGLIETLGREGITFWNSVPAIMNLVVDRLPEGYVNSALKSVLLSGDWIPLGLPGKVLQHFPKASVVSLGGATEGSIWSIYYPIREVKPEWKSIPYGYPLSNQRFYVINDEGELSPVNVPGELYIGGRGVASGYMNDSEKSNRVFIEKPPFGRLYKTGDYGVLHREGYIEFLGRRDFQIKIKGYRIELGEIESCILRYSNARNCVVVDWNRPDGKKFLCAYIVSDEEVDFKKLKGRLEDTLPEYMIPVCFMKINEIKLTANGKVDRKALPQPDPGSLVETAYVAPSDEVEKELAGIWQSVLNLERIGVHDNFFDLGGDSILLIRAHTLIEKVYSGKVRVVDLFSNPTVSKLAAFIQGRHECAALPGIERGASPVGSTGEQAISEKDFEDAMMALFDRIEKGDTSIDEAINDYFQ